MTDAAAAAVDNVTSTVLLNYLKKTLNAPPEVVQATPFARVYSPVTFNKNWSWGGRLLFMVFASCYGTIFNIFFVSSFCRDRYLNRPGNMFLTCAGLADLLITAVVAPVCAVVILSGQWDNDVVCRVLQFTCITATYGYIMQFTFVALENYYKTCHSQTRYRKFLTVGLGYICFAIWALSILLGFAGVTFGLDYDYCQRLHYGNVYFRVATTVILQAMPSLFTVFFFARAIVKVKKIGQVCSRCRRTKSSRLDYSITVLNAIAYLLFLMSWMPYVIIVHEYPGTSDALYYHAVVIGLFRAVFVSSIYGIFNTSYRRAYSYFFNYCCCKSTVSSSYTHRRRRRRHTSGTDRDTIYARNQQAASESGTEETQYL